MCGKPWSGAYQEVTGAKLYFCCGDHYKEFRRIIQRAIAIDNIGRVKAVLISINGGERSIRVEDCDGRVVTINESIFNLTEQ
ncbi:TA0938 family protein [Vulcanisaeta distributa]|uniref:TA0938 family protein n=1 Tax=Vulcanisaeta distributa TaxID=164451 RepID=UPI000AD943AD|nr:TA0938 family protein [Vulcanisaeta distributa]